MWVAIIIAVFLFAFYKAVKKHHVQSQWNAVIQQCQLVPPVEIKNRVYVYGIKHGYLGYHDDSNAFFQVNQESGITQWFKEFNGAIYLHRANGPAIEYADGYQEYWQNGRRLTQNQVKQMKAQGY